MNIRQKLAMLDELDDHMDAQGGEAMKGMSMDDDDESMGHEEPEGGPAALVVSVGGPKDGPPKPPMPPSGGGDPAAELAKACMDSSDPKVKALAEALLKTKGV